MVRKSHGGRARLLFVGHRRRNVHSFGGDAREVVPRSPRQAGQHGDRAGHSRQTVHSRRLRTQLHRARHRCRHDHRQRVQDSRLGAERRAYFPSRPQDRRHSARHPLQPGRARPARQALGRADRVLRARLGRAGAMDGIAPPYLQLHGRSAVRRRRRLRRIGGGRRRARGPGQVGGNRLHHRHHPGVRRDLHVPLPRDRPSARHGLYPIRRRWRARRSPSSPAASKR